MQDDLRRTDEATSDEAIIDIVVSSANAEFASTVAQRFEGNFGPGPGEGEWTAIRTRLTASLESQILVQNRSFLTWNAARGEWIDTQIRPTQQVTDLLAAHVVEASRDLALDLSRRTSDWGRVLANLGIPDSVRQDLEMRIKELSLKVREASPTLSVLANQLLEMRSAQPNIEEVEIRPLPDRLEDLTHSVDVAVAGGQGHSALPMRLQGLGTRSLATLRVYFALCKLRVGADKGVQPHIMTLLEEPEAHLHPQAQAAVYRSIRELPGQVVVATHSSVLIGEAPIQAVRLLRHSSDGIAIHKLDDETAKKAAVFRRFISRPLGELFFSRLVVLVDGAAERGTIPVLLSSALGRDVAGLGVTVLDMQSQTKERLQKIIDALHVLGETPWVAFVDNDPNGLASIDGCVDSEDAPLSESHPRVVICGRKQLEQLLLDAGYHEEIRTVAREYSQSNLPAPEIDERGDPHLSNQEEKQYMSFLKRSKGWSGELICIQAMKNGRAIPGPIVELADRIEKALGLGALSGTNSEENAQGTQA